MLSIPWTGQSLSRKHLAEAAVILFLSRALAELGSLVLWPAGAIAGGLAGAGLGWLVASRLKWTRASISLYLLWLYILYPGFSLGWMLFVLAAMGTFFLAERYPDLQTHWPDAIIFALFLALYWLTLSPGLLSADAGEFQMVAAHLGVAHPPGYPLYILIGKLFTLMTPGNPMRGLNLFSAVTAALTVMLVGRVTRTFAGNVWAGIVAAIVYGVAASVWATAAQASIRPLTGFFAALCIERLSAYWLTRRQSALYGFMLALGLSITHHPSLLFPGLIFCIYVLLIDPSLIRQPRRWPKLIGAFALGFVPWLYIVLVARFNSEYAPAGIETWSGFWRHVLAQGFSGDVFFVRSPAGLLDRVLVWIDILKLQWNGWLLLIAIIAAWMVAWRNWRLFILLAGSFLLHSLMTMTYRAPQTVEYLIPAYVSLAILIGVGLGYATNSLETGNERFLGRVIPTGGQILLGITLAISLSTGVKEWPSFRALSQDQSTQATVDAIFDAAPPGAVILANWHWVTPLQAAQSLQGRRPDLDIEYVYPVGIQPLSATWLDRIADELPSRSVIVTQMFPSEFEGSPYFFEPLDAGWLVQRQPRRDVPADMRLLDSRFDNGIALVGVDASKLASFGAGEAGKIRLAWRIDEPQSQPLTGFVHLTLADGTFISGWDQALPTDRAAPGDVLVSAYTIAAPVDLPAGDYLLQAGIYGTGQDGTLVNGRIDGQLQIPVGNVTVTPARWPAPTASPRSIHFANGARVYGTDWEGETLYVHSILPDGAPRTLRTIPDQIQSLIQAEISAGTPRLGPWGIPLGTTIPLRQPVRGERYVPLGGQMVLSRVSVSPSTAPQAGDPVIVTVGLLASRPLTTDNVVKVDVTGADGWNVQDDSIPATGAVPTLKWLCGWLVTDRHRLTIPADASSPASHVDLLVYDNFSGQRLPTLDPVLAEQGITVRIFDWTP